MKKPQKKWTLKEVDLCLALRAKGMTVREIARFLERSYLSVDGYLRRDSIERARQNRKQNDDRRAIISHQVTKVLVPTYVLAERDRRVNEYRTPAQIMMGDPPFSQSALGRHPGNTAD